MGGGGKLGGGGGGKWGGGEKWEGHNFFSLSKGRVIKKLNYQKGGYIT